MQRHQVNRQLFPVLRSYGDTDVLQLEVLEGVGALYKESNFWRDFQKARGGHAMDEWKRLCSHVSTENRIVSSLEESGLSSLMKEAVLKEIIKPSVNIEGLEETVYNTISKSGWGYTRIQTLPKQLV